MKSKFVTKEQQIIHGLLRIAEVSVPDSFHNTDSKIRAARIYLRHKLRPCGHSEPESDYRDPDTGKHRTAVCEGGKLVIRGNGQDSVTDGTMWMGSRPCKCADTAPFLNSLEDDLGREDDE